MLMIVLLSSFAFSHDGDYDSIQGGSSIEEHFAQLQADFEGKTFEEINNSITGILKNSDIEIQIANSTLRYYVYSSPYRITKITDKANDTYDDDFDFYLTADEDTLHRLFHSDSPINDFKQAKSNGDIELSPGGVMGHVKIIFLSIALFFVG